MVKVTHKGITIEGNPDDVARLIQLMDAPKTTVTVWEYPVVKVNQPWVTYPTTDATMTTATSYVTWGTYGADGKFTPGVGG